MQKPTYVLEVEPRPFLKWAGGKDALVPVIRENFPKVFHTYREPFLGGGAVFFRSRSLFRGPVQLCDVNEELIDTYKVVQHPLGIRPLIAELKKYRYEAAEYYERRAMKPVDLSPIQRAARMVYLNKCCFNGLYRVNRSGQFNVPMGRYKDPVICPEELLLAAHEAFLGVELACCQYNATPWPDLRHGDFCYMDPPYAVAEGSKNFIEYTDSPFGPDAQEGLADYFDFHVKHGKGYMLLSNADVPWVRERYAKYRMVECSRSGRMNSNGKDRGRVKELLIIGGY